MHESGLARDLFKIMLEKAAEKRLDRVARVAIKAGEASGIEPGFLLHSLEDHIFPGTPAEGCSVEISLEKVSAVCAGCGNNYGNDPVFKCVKCGSGDFRITGGKDVRVEDVE